MFTYLTSSLAPANGSGMLQAVRPAVCVIDDYREHWSESKEVHFVKSQTAVVLFISTHWKTPNKHLVGASLIMYMCIWFVLLIDCSVICRGVFSQQSPVHRWPFRLIVSLLWFVGSTAKLTRDQALQLKHNRDVFFLACVGQRLWGFVNQRL